MKLYHSRPRWRRTRDRVLPVEGGQVMCPHDGPVDVEHCWMCPRYRGTSIGSDEAIVCAVSVRPMPVVSRSVTV